MKKILFIIDNLGSGGAQNQITLLAIGFKNAGYNVKVFTYFPQDFFKHRLDVNDIKVIYVPKKGKLGLNVIKTLRETLIADKIDVIISFMDTPNLYTILASRFINITIKTIISYRTKTDFSSLSSLTLFMKKWLNRKASYIVTNSFHEKQTLGEKWNNIIDKIYVIYNCVDQSKYNFIETTDLPERYLVVGSIGKDKNGLVILEAMRKLKDLGLNIKLDWIGQQVLHLEDRKQYLGLMNGLIDKYNLRNHFNWVKPHINLELEYRNHKALILASETEGLPNVVCEAMSCGLPVILSNVLDHPNLIQNGFSGFLFDPKEISSLVESIVNMEKLNKADYQAMKQNAYLKSLDLFDYSTFVDKFIKIIN